MYLIDVRTVEEFAERHAEDAINIPLHDLSEGKMPDIPKDSEVRLYCRSGARSGVAQDIMQHNGFTNVTNVGGFSDVLTNNNS